MRFRSSAHALARAGAAAPNSHLLVSLQIGGAARLVQGGRQVAVAAGSGAVGLLDAARPFELSFPDEVERVFCYVPHAILRARAPWLAGAQAASLGGDNPISGILREYLLRLGDPGDPLDERAAYVLLDGFLGALAIATTTQRARSDAPAVDRRAIRLDGLRAHMRRQIGDPSLSPASVGRAFGLSPRSVHKLFEGSGASFSAWLLIERLESCARALRAGDPSLRIADAAFAAGFNDLSHFNRCFKARFKTTPRAGAAPDRSLVAI